jgi:hypothetical protein
MGPNDVQLVLGRLDQMREEQRDDHSTLVVKVDGGFESVRSAAADHEVKDTERFASINERLVVIENNRRTLRWLSATMVAAFITGVVDFFFSHGRLR